MDNIEKTCKIMQILANGVYPNSLDAFWENHMTDKKFVLSLLEIICESYYSTDPTIGELLDKIETHIEKVIK
jgi:hypothetical protein